MGSVASSWTRTISVERALPLLVVELESERRARHMGGTVGPCRHAGTRPKPVA
jgi:hypothetical protein